LANGYDGRGRKERVFAKTNPSGKGRYIMVAKRLKLVVNGLCSLSLLLVAGCAEADVEQDFGAVLEKVHSASS